MFYPQDHEQGYAVKLNAPFFLAIVIFTCLSFTETTEAETQNEIIALPEALTTENIPPISSEVAARAKKFSQTRPAFSIGWQNDGQGIFISTRFGQTAQLFEVRHPLGMRRQLTFFDETIVSPQPSPSDSNQILYLMDQGGSERFTLYTLDQSTGLSAKQSHAQRRASWPVWDHHGDQFAWIEAAEGGKSVILTQSIHSDAPAKQVTMLEGSWFPLLWTRDSKQILLYHFRSLDDSEIHFLNIQDGSLTQINADLTNVAYGRVALQADGQHLLLAMNVDGNFLKLYRYNLETQKRELLTGDINWDVEFVATSPDGKTYAVVFNEGGQSRLQLYRSKDNKPIPSPKLDAGVIQSVVFSPDGKSILFDHNTATSPGDVWEWAIRGRQSRLIRWTQGEIGGLDAEYFVKAEAITFPTFDRLENGNRRMIPAFYYPPRPSETPAPVIVSIHGGPPAQARPVFSADIQYWLDELGAAVIRPNVRGSTGYGEAFQLLDNGRRREDAVRDIGALLDWIDDQPELDANRVVVIGASYGGYMTLASLVAYGSRLAGGVDIVGISNFVTFLESTAEFRRATRRPEYGDERDPSMRDFLNKISPLTNAEKICQPLFVVQGENDIRVPASEARQIIDAVQANGAYPWVMFASNEGHGFRRTENVAALNAAIVVFFKAVFNGDLPSGCPPHQSGEG